MQGSGVGFGDFIFINISSVANIQIQICHKHYGTVSRHRGVPGIEPARCVLLFIVLPTAWIGMDFRRNIRVHRTAFGSA